MAAADTALVATLAAAETAAAALKAAGVAETGTVAETRAAIAETVSSDSRDSSSSGSTTLHLAGQGLAVPVKVIGLNFVWII